MNHQVPLRFTSTALRLLIAVNWLLGLGILMLLMMSIVREQWTFAAIGIPLPPEPGLLVLGMRAIMVVGLISIPLHYMVLKGLLAIVDSVSVGDPFLAANADRLMAIAWQLLALQILSLIVGAVSASISTAAHPIHLDAGFSPSGWLAVFMTFVLARVFALGASMRDDLEGTV